MLRSITPTPHLHTEAKAWRSEIGGEIGRNSFFGGTVDLWLSLKDSPLVCVRHLTLSNRGLIKQSIFGDLLLISNLRQKHVGKLAMTISWLAMYWLTLHNPQIQERQPLWALMSGIYLRQRISGQNSKIV